MGWKQLLRKLTTWKIFQCLENMELPLYSDVIFLLSVPTYLWFSKPPYNTDQSCNYISSVFVGGKQCTIISVLEPSVSQQQWCSGDRISPIFKFICIKCTSSPSICHNMTYQYNLSEMCYPSALWVNKTLRRKGKLLP